MSLFYKVVTEPTFEPFELQFVKDYLKVHTEADDAFIDFIISAARIKAEQYTGISICKKKIEQRFDRFEILLAVGNVKTVDSITYINTEGDTSTVDPSVYALKSFAMLPKVSERFSKQWPTDLANEAEAVAVLFWGGEETAAAISKDIRTAILLTIGEMYANREDFVNRFPTAAQTLLEPYKVRHFV